MSDKERIKALESQVKELVRFMNEKKRQQISFPLDQASQNIIKKII